VAICCIAAASLYAGTNVTVVDPHGNIPPADLAQVEQDVKSTVDGIIGSMGPGMSRASTMASVIGYPLGDPILSGERFDHFFFGVSLNGAVTNPRAVTQSGSGNDMPGVMGNPTLYFGFPLAKRMDLLVKLMVYDDNLYLPPLSLAGIRITAFDIYTLGARFRWNAVKRYQVFPGLFEFAGLTLSGGLNLTYGRLGLSGKFPMPAPTVTVTNVYPAPPPATLDVDLQYVPDMDILARWFQATVTVQTTAFIDFLWIFDLYLGLGLATGLGFMDLDFQSSGDMTTNHPDVTATNGDDVFLNVDVDSTSRHYPPLVMPYATLGVDLNLFLFHLTVEAIVNIWNMQDVALQAGWRTQW
jgi:hypothetical protein